jgi:hypothetical protein
MARTARITTHFVAIPCADPRGVEYAVEKRQGSARWTIGRVARCGGYAGDRPVWIALGVGARAWTRYLPTRALAVADMEAGLTGFDFLNPRVA